MSPDEVRSVQLHVTDEFSHVCRAAGLEFQLAFGTLLGAVRHGGYIPWDDDIDVAMLRSDFELFCTNYASYCGDGSLILGSRATDDKWPLPYAKLWDARTVVFEDTDLPLHTGVGIDVFPIDDLPSSGLRRECIMVALSILRGLFALLSVRPRANRRLPKAAILRVAKPLVISIGAARVADLMTRFARSGGRRSDHSGVVLVHVPWTVPRDSLARSTWEPFEGLRLPIPMGWDQILTTIYGNFRTLPPEEERRTHHAASAYWK